VDTAATGNRREPFDRGAALHALGRRRGFVAGDLALVAAVDDDGRPATGTRIPAARPVGVERDVGRRRGRAYAGGSCQ
jgi:hypothetical protein